MAWESISERLRRTRSSSGHFWHFTPRKSPQLLITLTERVPQLATNGVVGSERIFWAYRRYTEIEAASQRQRYLRKLGVRHAELELMVPDS